MLQEIQVRGGVKKRPHPLGGGGWIFSGITQLFKVFFFFAMFSGQDVVILNIHKKIYKNTMNVNCNLNFFHIPDICCKSS